MMYLSKLGNIRAYSVDVTRACVICGGLFHKSVPNQRVCSANECKRKAQRAREQKRREQS